MAIGPADVASAIGGIFPPGGGGGDPALAFDRTRPDQHIPMIPAGLRGEIGRQEDQLRAGPAQRQEHFRKPKIVADRAAHFDASHLVDDDRVAPGIGGAFFETHAIRGGNVE